MQTQIKIKIKKQKPRKIGDLVEHITILGSDEHSDRLYADIDVNKMADFLKEYLKIGEFIEVDSLGNNINSPSRFERYIEILRLNGLDIGRENKEFRYFSYPPISATKKTRKLYVSRRK